MLEELDYGAVQFWWNVGQTLILLFLAYHSLYHNRTKANKEAIDGLDTRVNILEQAHQHLPTHEDIQKLRKEIGDTTAILRELKGSYTATQTTLGMLHQHLLDKEK